MIVAYENGIRFFTGLNLSGINLRGLDLRDCDFLFVNLVYASS